MGDGGFSVTAACSLLAAPIDDVAKIFIRRFDANGVPLTDLLAVNEFAPQFGSSLPRIARSPSGKAMIVWADENAAGFDVKGRIFDPEGVALSPEFELAAGSNGPQYVPWVAALPGERFVAVWEGETSESAIYDVVFRIFSSGGSPLSGEVPVSETSAVDRYQPSLSSDAAGHFVIAWKTDGEAGRSQDVYARLFRSEGSPAGDEVLISDDITRAERADSWPFVALSDSGAFVVTWEADSLDPEVGTLDVAARRYFRGCAPGAERLRLGGGRFEVCTLWRTPQGDEGAGHPVPLTADTGGFWFFGADNLEVVVKILDGCGVDENFWVYAAGLTDVEVTLGVIDTWSGRTWIRDTVLGTPFPPIQDVLALPVCDAVAPSSQGLNPQAAALRSSAQGTGERPGPGAELRPDAIEGSCAADSTHLCLNRARFRVSATFASAVGLAGQASAVPLTPDSGSFWFFGADNLELFVKVLDACVPYERYWVYTAGLTDVGVHLTVEDTVAHETRIYDNASGHPFEPILDASAFATCP
ncbi:MAG: hypothetical protein U0X73_15180 [Thermoanaerobaculia bacterium]